MAKEILKDEMMSDDELEHVSGGTKDETYELTKAIGKMSCGRELFYSELAPYLKGRYNIDAKISYHGVKKNVLGLPIPNFGEANEYSRDGQTLTHQEVLDIIKGK